MTITDTYIIVTFDTIDDADDIDISCYSDDDSEVIWLLPRDICWYDSSEVERLFCCVLTEATVKSASIGTQSSAAWPAHDRGDRAVRDSAWNRALQWSGLIVSILFWGWEWPCPGLTSASLTTVILMIFWYYHVICDVYLLLPLMYYSFRYCWWCDDVDILWWYQWWWWCCYSDMFILVVKYSLLYLLIRYSYCSIFYHGRPFFGTFLTLFIHRVPPTLPCWKSTVMRYTFCIHCIPLPCGILLMVFCWCISAV